MISSDEIQAKVDRAFNCDCSDKKLRYKLSRAGVKMFYLQCTKCGDYNRIPKDKVTSPSSPLIQLIDDELRRNWWRRRSEYSQKLYTECQNRERKEWFDWYDKYLQSPEWSKKRVAVLKRANFICEGCLEKTAVQVHHLTYKRVGKEMLFDLRAVCFDCHRTIHDSENQTA